MARHAGYATAVLSVGAATLLRAAVSPALQGRAPFIPFFMAVVLSAWHGGLGPGVLALVLSVVAVAWLFIPPPDSLIVGSAADWFSLALFALTAFGIALVGEAQRRSRHRAGQSAAAAHRNAELMTTTLRAIGDAVLATDARGRVTFLNPIAEALTGWDAAEAVGRPATEVFRVAADDPRGAALNPVDQVLREGRVVEFASHTLRPDRNGPERSIEDSGAPVRDHAGRLVGVVLVFRDVTERTRAEVARRQQQALLESVLQVTDVMLALVDTEFNFVWVNAPYAQSCNMPAEELVGRNHFELYPHAENEAIFRHVRETGEPVFYKDKPFEFPDQPERGVTYWDWSLTAVKDAAGSVTGLVFTLRETTNFVRSQQALQETEGRYRNLFENMTEEVHLWQVVRGEDGSINTWQLLDANPPTLRSLGCATVDELRGRTADAVFGPGATARHLSVVERVMAEGAPHSYEDYFPHLDKHFRVTSVPLDGDRFFTTAADITEVRKAQEELQGLNVRLQRAMAETHHRVKNNLQVIAALIDMQRMEDEPTVPSTELERLGRHVRGLAAIHDLLTREARANGATEYISIREALAKLKPLLESMVEGRELRFDIEDARLPLRQGTALAVLVNELVSNAVKHGDGAILLTMAVTGGRATLCVRDHGVGFPSGFAATAAAHTGLELVQSVGCWDLQGEVEFANAPDGGAVVSVYFPMPAG